jgi:hypothetical protein
VNGKLSVALFKIIVAIVIAISIAQPVAPMMPRSTMSAAVNLQPRQAYQLTVPASQMHGQNGATPETAAAGYPAASAQSSAQPEMVYINSDAPVSTPGKVNSVVVIPEIYGLTPSALIPSNSTSVTDHSGNVLNCSNIPYNISANGTVVNFSFTLSGNLTEGPFSLSIHGSGTTYELGDAGIVSVPGVNPSIFAYPASSYSGGRVTILAGGFFQNESLGNVVIGNRSYAGTSLLTDTNGAGYLKLILPALPFGNYSVRFIAQPAEIGHGSVVPHLLLGADNGSVGEVITGFLSGFAANQNVNVEWEDSSVSYTGVANITGSLVVALAVPVMSYGYHQVTASSSGTPNASAFFFVNVPTLVIKSKNGSPGQMLPVQGYGFSPGSSVSLYIGGKILPNETGEANSKGHVEISFYIPGVVSGYYELMLASNNSLVSNTVSFVIIPVIDIIHRSIAVSSQLQIYGMFFIPNSQVDIELDGNGIIGTIMTSSNGTLNGDLRLPQVPGGLTLISALQANGINSAPVGITVVPSLTSNTYTGFAGERIIVSGTGFKPGESLSVQWNHLNTDSSLTVNSSGSFSIPFTIPSATPGVYLVTVNSTGPYIVFTVAQNIPFLYFLPSFLIPFFTGVVSSVYIYRKLRIGRKR